MKLTLKKLKKSKIVIIGLLIVLILVFYVSTPTVELLNRGIVIGIAIDKENEDLVLTVQALLPTESSTGSKGSYAVFASRGVTIEDALNNLGDSLGNIMSLGQCQVVVLGRSFLESGVFSSMSYLVKSQRVADSVYLVAAHESAADILRSDVVVEDVATYYLERQFQNQSAHLGINVLTLKDFFRNYYTHAGINCIPVAYPVPTGNENDEGESSSSKQTYFMRLSSVAICDKTGMQIVMGERDASVLSFVNRPLDNGSLEFEVEGKGYSSVSILKSAVKKSFEMDGALNANFKVIFDIKIMDREHENGLEENERLVLTEEETAAFKAEVKKSVKECFETGQKESLDIFNLYEGFYKKYGNAFKNAAGEQYLDIINFSVDVEFIMH